MENADAFWAAPCPFRPVEHSTVKQRLLCVLKSVYKIKFFHYSPFLSLNYWKHPPLTAEKVGGSRSSSEWSFITTAWWCGTGTCVARMPEKWIADNAKDFIVNWNCPLSWDMECYFIKHVLSRNIENTNVKKTKRHKSKNLCMTMDRALEGVSGENCV